MQLTQQHKEEIKEFILLKKKQLGSQAAVATYCEVSNGVISLMLRGEYNTEGDSMWLQVGTKLGWRISIGQDDKGWKIAADTYDCKTIYRALTDAKSLSLYMPFSDYAGIGKSTAVKYYVNMQQEHGSVYYVCCWDWNVSLLLKKIAQKIGLNLGRGGYKTNDDILNEIIEFFNDRATLKPQLILDQYDKLKDAAKRVIIPMFNELEDVLSVIVVGTEHLKAQIKRGVAHKTNGFDEIDSRLGREYMTLMGSSLSDIKKMCAVNSITNELTVKNIFEELKPVRKMIKVKKEDKEEEVQIRVVTDTRRLKRIVQREQLKQLK